MNSKQVFFIIAVLAVSLPATVCAVQAAEITPTVVYSTGQRGTTTIVGPNWQPHRSVLERMLFCSWSVARELAFCR
ncbi:hypothetical protein SAMN02744133_10411 [Thalassospira xiamenensis M-5 = DSM 17429]|uniref:Uncharacterized protein n=1 Tax=Thalassospira xiamenensis M-5 = DSM 17429 TaxID=1123366 RepID=A0AB72UC83_9PROT|nr:hypothetical protein [Thalassospira xiamenensis]AJD51950.1 hypothetical protein TH3_09160 [Thalassospira xiamenensis M-5 = DSM 17429]SIS97548.1 hypothetical protein SAMN02744133_10411 [Thalassospira xiamenensis M-5 = DSM 17429]